MSTLEELRQMTKIARLAYELKLNQTEIAARLGISQAGVSRLLKRAQDEGIVRISIQIPTGVHADLEEALIQRFQLKEAIVVESLSADENQMMRDLGRAAAYYIETTLRDQDVVGISSWSSSLLALLDAMQPVTNRKEIQVVQILGGVGNPSAEIHATRLTGRFAGLVNGSSIFLPAPGIVGSEAALHVLMDDPYVQEALQLFDSVSLALVGIGTVEPSRLLSLSGNVFPAKEQDDLRRNGAVGDILLRFFDAMGQPVESTFNQRVISMSLAQLRQVERSVGVAGGARKYAAILGALRGKWINILVTDRLTAENLIKEPHGSF